MIKSINDFYKKISVKDKEGKEIFHEVFDFEKIWNDEAFFFFLISERGRKGKTYGAKLLGQQLYLDNGYPFVFAKNLSVQTLKDSRNFLSAVENLQEFQNFNIDRAGVFSINEDKEKEYSCLFRSLNGADKDKGSRQEANLIILDEAMDGVGDLRGSQTDLIRTMMETFSNPVDVWNKKLRKVIILANFKTLNSKLLFDLGIYTVEQQLTNILDSNGKVLTRILIPQYDDNAKLLIEEALKGEPIFEFGKITNTNDSNIFNENVGDVYQNINEVKETDLFKLEYRYIFKSENQYFHCFEKNSGLHVITTDHYEEGLGLRQVLSLDKKSIAENAPEVSIQIKNNLITMLSNNLISFQNIFSRSNFIKAILK